MRIPCGQFKGQAIRAWRTFFLSTLSVVAVSTRAATTNSWIKPISGDWQDASAWSLGREPDPGDTVMIANPGWKAVAIAPGTGSRDVASIILGGDADSFNLLLLNYTGFVQPVNAGMISVGTNSAITALASVLNVSSNSGPGELSILAAFNQGEQAIVNAHSINFGNVTNLVAGAGTYNQTNGIVNADEVSLANGSTFNQFDGANAVGTLWMGAANSISNYGVYNMANGWLTADSIEIYRGDFNQTGGLVTSVLDLGGTYTLSAGTLRVPGINIPQVPCGLRNPCPNSIGVNATLLQTGGTNFCDGPLAVFNMRGAPGVGASYYGPGHYVLSNGVLYVSGTVNSGSPYFDAGGDFQQWGGWHTNAGTVAVGIEMGGLGGPRLSSFIVGGGTLVTPSISVDYADFNQSGGTNLVSDVHVGTGKGLATFALSGGLLAAQNTTIELMGNEYFGAYHVLFAQSGGTHIVTNLLRISGTPPSSFYSPYSSSAYVLSNGVLSASNIQIDNGAYFTHYGGTLMTSGLLNLGQVTWNEKATGQQFGQLLLSAPAGSNATFSLPSGNNCVVRFANSSSVMWSNQANLFIENWKGSPTGGGQHQVVFGSNASGLTAQQLSQIQFVNPEGNPGMSPAAILASGEIVPARMLASQRTSNGLTLQWPAGTLQSATNVSGPYEDVPGAASPYSILFDGPNRFFRLRF